MNNAVVFGVAAVPAIAGLVEVCKDLGLPTRAAPLAAVLFGIALGILQFYSPQLPQGQSAVIGAALGLSASGLYSGAGALLGKPAPVPPEDPGPTPPPPDPPGPGEPMPLPTPSTGAPAKRVRARTKARVVAKPPAEPTAAPPAKEAA